MQSRMQEKLPSSEDGKIVYWFGFVIWNIYLK